MDHLLPEKDTPTVLYISRYIDSDCLEIISFNFRLYRRSSRGSRRMRSIVNEELLIASLSALVKKEQFFVR